MKEENFLKGLKYLGIAYNKEFNEEQARVWYDFFKDVDYDVFRNAVKRIITKNKYLPSIAELKEEIAIIDNPVLQLDVDEEWAKVVDAVRKYGSKEGEIAFEQLNPITKEIVRSIGWYSLCMSENIEFQRKTFKEIFLNKQNSIKKTNIVNDSNLTKKELSNIEKYKLIGTEDYD